MKDFFILKVLDRFKFLFKLMNIDYINVRKILYMKLLMDTRRTPSILHKKKSENKNYFLSSLLVYGFMGLFLITMVLFIGKNQIYQFTLIFTMILFFVSSALITDFSSVILDLRDKTIVLTKPVEAKTLTVAKSLHILIYLMMITLALTGPAMIVTLFKYGLLFALLFIGEIILIDLMVVVLTTLFYLIVLRFSSGEKLKDIINYVQILLSVTIAIGYQFLNRFTLTLGGDYHFENWHYVIVPLWFVAPFQFILNGNHTNYFLIMSLLAILVPIVLFILYTKLIPNFEKYLEKLNQEKEVKIKKSKDPDAILKYIIPNNEERTLYRFVAKMMKNEREFKLKVYPQLGMSLVFPFIFLFNGTISGGIPHYFFFFIYFSLLLIPSVSIMLAYSSKYKAAWIFEALPISHPKVVRKAAFKAILFRLIIPINLIIGIIFFFLFGVNLIPDLLVILLVSLILSLIVYSSVNHSLPFSEPNDQIQSSQQAFMFLLMFGLLFLAGIHYVFTLFTYGIYIYLVVLLIAYMLLWKSEFKIKQR